MEHRTGKGRQRGPFLPAFRKESEFNERVRTVFKSTGQGGHPEGMNIEVTQISGAMARTIVPWSHSGMGLRRGQRYGMIRLGSRVDTRAPAMNFTPLVVGAEAEDEKFPKGEYVYAGKTILFSPSRPE
jgi:phosphatidylserine decarboxylase